MAGLTVGYARCTTDAQDLTAQREALERLFAEAKGAGYHAGVTSPRATGSIAVQPWLGLGRPRHREQEPWAYQMGNVTPGAPGAPERPPFSGQ
ncbi:MAG: hypothetical protein E6G66_14270 [Actinobacteria bacterium]|nr:MAG: hypothetical protein E6G66_14270 [Actinomycetota bacterium]